MQATIDKSGCISCGLCEDTCPDVFKLDSDGIANVCRQPDASNISFAIDAMECCPTGVITVQS